MEVRVDNKVLLVTGSVQGLGRAIALEAARSGAEAIILTDHPSKRGDDVLAELYKLGTNAAFVPADLMDQDTPVKLVAAAVEKFGRLDGLVNAAGLSDRGSAILIGNPAPGVPLDAVVGGSREDDSRLI